jgi:hypothetical protein
MNEILQYNKVIISEYSNKDDWYNMELYKDLVLFYNDFDDLYKLIDFYLDPINYNNYIQTIDKNRNILMQKLNYFFNKNLISIIPNSATKLEYDLNSETIYCLHLIETPYRMETFRNQSYIPNIEIYPAIKYSPGWVGCGLSYSNLMWNAKRCNLDTVTICEDDCEFPNDFEEKYSIIKEFLSGLSEWDIFVGCVAFMPEDTNIINVYDFKGIKFIEIDKMHSTVFNIYNKSCYDKIINWDNQNLDVHTNTIDQYIKRQNMKIIITYPFYFRCTNIMSTLWGVNCYNDYENSFKESQKLIKNKLEIFYNNK